MNGRVANNFKEVIFIGIPGPTHNYGGLSGDNVASSANEGQAAHPREAALQAIALARLLLSLGITVGLLPPQLRPHTRELKKYFTGDEAQLIAQAAKENPELLEAMSSSSAMWVANAATVTPPQDSQDGKLHITVANLHTNIHRRIEALDTYLTLRQIFAHVPNAVVDLPLTADKGFRDEGDANHMRLAPSHDAPGLNVFVYGTDDNPRDPQSARQTLATSQEIIARHQLFEDAAICLKQNPVAIEKGVFHNDVIALSNESFLLVHEDAYSLGSADLAYLEESYRARTGAELNMRVVRRSELSIKEAVATYFFNSQLVSLPTGGMALIAPAETQQLYDGKAWALIQSLIADGNNPINSAHIVDLTQSMKNGGGPACLRLRVPMDEAQLRALAEHKRVLASDALLSALEYAVTRTYPETLHGSQIDYNLYLRCRESLGAIGECLKLDLLPG